MTSDGAPPDDGPSEFDTATPVVRGGKYRVSTTQLNVFRLPVDYMTISFMFDSASQHGDDYPKYLLESTDGAYKKELSPKSDLKKPKDYYELRFASLLPGKLYRLTRSLDADYQVVLFDGLDFGTIVDQDRDAQGLVVDHDYGEYEVDLSSIVDA